MMSKLTEIISSEEQNLWRNNISYSPLGNRIIPNETNTKYIRAFEKFQKLPQYQIIFDLVAAYIKNCVMYPFLTMPNYWTCNCFSRKEGEKKYMYIRVNMADQEVFTVKVVEAGIIKWTLNESIEKQDGLDVEKLKNYFGLDKVEYWGDGHIGRISFYSESLEKAKELIHNVEFCQIIRHCNHRLMQRRTLHHPNHNYLLSQEIQLYLEAEALDELYYQQDILNSGGVEFLEGELLQRTITLRRRNTVLAKKAKDRAKQKGKLNCEICGFDFLKTYGEEFIEAHHKNPLAEREEAIPSQLDDIALVCANCHRMLHRRTPPYTIEELRKKLNDV